MAASVLIHLDTTPPILVVGAAQDAGDPTLVTLDLSADTDTAEMKVWGAIDDTDPLNASYGTNEAGADWIPYDPFAVVRAHPAGGELFIRVRDDVWNPSTPGSFEVVTDGTTPVEPPVTPPRRVPGWPVEPQKPRRTFDHSVRSTLGIRATARTGIHASEAARLRIRSRFHLSSSSANGSQTILRVRRTHVAAMRHDSDIQVRSTYSLTKSGISTTDVAALIELDII